MQFSFSVRLPSSISAELFGGEQLRALQDKLAICGCWTCHSKRSAGSGIRRFVVQPIYTAAAVIEALEKYLRVGPRNVKGRSKKEYEFSPSSPRRLRRASTAGWFRETVLRRRVLLSDFVSRGRKSPEVSSMPASINSPSMRLWKSGRRRAVAGDIRSSVWVARIPRPRAAPFPQQEGVVQRAD